MVPGGLRGRAVLDEWFPFVVVALLVLGAAGGWFTYATHVDPGVHTERRVVSTWATEAGIDHAATVRRENPVFPAGSTLRNREVYFRNVAPVLDGTVRFRYRATGGGNLTVRTDLRLVIHAVSDDGAGPAGGSGGTEYWRVERPLAERAAAGVRPGEAVTVPFSLNVTRIEGRVDEVTAALGGTPGRVEAVVRVRFRFDGTVAGEGVSRTQTHEMAVGIEGATYRVVEPGEMTREYERTRTAVVANTYGPLRRAGAPALFAAPLAALGLLAVARRRDRIALSDAERERLRFRDDRDDFDEWIVTVRLPDEVLDRPEARAETLADLADLAIDADTSVIEHPDRGAYYVVHGGLLYTYSPPGRGRRWHGEGSVGGLFEEGEGGDGGPPSEPPDGSGE